VELVLRDWKGWRDLYLQELLSTWRFRRPFCRCENGAESGEVEREGEKWRVYIRVAGGVIMRRETGGRVVR